MSIDSIGSILENHTKFAKYFEDANKNDMTIDTFYQLLIAEMSNQDPLEPMSNTEFISQMASFTSLQVQQEALQYGNSNYATSMVGKTVIVAQSTGAGLDVKSGVVTKVNLTGGKFEITVNGKEYPLKNVMEVIDTSAGIAAGSDGAFATSLIDKSVTVAYTDNVGSTVIESGIVQRVEVKDGELSVVIDDVSYPLYTVAKIEGETAAKNNEAASDGGSLEDGGTVI